MTQSEVLSPVVKSKHKWIKTSEHPPEIATECIIYSNHKIVLSYRRTDGSYVNSFRYDEIPDYLDAAPPTANRGSKGTQKN